MYTQFFVMFAMIFTGFFLRKIKFINEDMNNSLNKFIVYCAYPCMLTYNIGKMDMDKELIIDFLVMMLLSEIMFIGFALAMRVYTRIRRFPDRASNVAELAMVCPNNGFMGFPMALSFMGSQGLLFMMAQNSAMNIFFFTYTLYTLRRNSDNKEKLTLQSVFSSVIKVLLNPNILALFVGFFICLTNISLDNGMGIYLNYIGGAATPMAMIFIGSTLAGSHFFEMLKNHIVLESAINKLLIIPIVTTGVMMLLPVSNEIKVIMVLGFCFPTAATIPMLAEQEKQNHELASKILFFSTVISMATVPLTISLIKILFL